VNPYETTRLLDEYLLFHYGSPDEVLPWPEGPQSALGFAERTVSELADFTRQPATGLDLGCAVGRSSFELARRGLEVIGIDFSQRFIDAAATLATGASLGYRRLDEGAAATELVARAPAFAPPGQVRFETGDAMNLRPDLGAFDLVHAANLLCRLTDPERLIDHLPALVKPGGQLLLATPCTWLEEYTPRDRWPQHSTLDWLKRRLDRDFALELQKDLPFLIREHARKYQWSVALGTRWIRR
jgi:putative 4-mercaptohistidine N1-methyltranferase